MRRVSNIRLRRWSAPCEGSFGPVMLHAPLCFWTVSPCTWSGRIRSSVGWTRKLCAPLNRLCWGQRARDDQTRRPMQSSVQNSFRPPARPGPEGDPGLSSFEPSIFVLPFYLPLPTPKRKTPERLARLGTSRGSPTAHSDGYAQFNALPDQKKPFT